ncbi:hypothetical protein MRY82_01855 [bacterium]|nr:hypothetical protein [bacterium]
MIKGNFTICHLSGSDINYSALKSLIKLHEKKLHLSHFASNPNNTRLSFNVNHTSNDLDSLETALDFIASHLNKKNFGIEEISLILHLEYVDQCNWEYSLEQLKTLTKLNLSLGISCFAS